MHVGFWFNDTGFDSFDYLVLALLLFILAAAKWSWRYWRRESLRARRIVLSLLTRVPAAFSCGSREAAALCGSCLLDWPSGQSRSCCECRRAG